VTTVQVVRTYVELRDRQQLKPAGTAERGVSYERQDGCTAAHYRALYSAVGGAWAWRDRLKWTDAELQQHLDSPGVALWECKVLGETAGYFELQRHDDGAVEIVYFGLVEKFFGRRLGAAMLTRAAQEGWAMGAERVWLHTCTLDSPRALPNYLARGFERVRQETYTEEFP
jgi:ribosomal protein S18 acetylase RimI-like enzyme